MIGEISFSVSKGPPGVMRIIKKAIVIKKNKVGIATKKRRIKKYKKEFESIW
tara:strand:- start:296 stop:451 length:156 start_codon:yes stop_codon:yes gene_type:complete